MNVDDFALREVLGDIAGNRIIYPFSIRIWARNAHRPFVYGTEFCHDISREVDDFCQKMFDMSLSHTLVDFRRCIISARTSYQGVELQELVNSYDLIVDYSNDHDTNITPELVEAFAKALKAGLMREKPCDISMNYTTIATAKGWSPTGGNQS